MINIRLSGEKLEKQSHDFVPVIALGYCNVVRKISQKVFKLET